MDTVRAVAQLQRSGATLSRVTQATGLTVSTSFRILRSLAEERMLRYDESARCYYIGPLAFELGLAASSQAIVQDQWRDTIDEVARQTRLTTYLMAQSDKEAVCLLCAQGFTAIRAMPMDIGQRLPLGIGAGSTAILAALDDDEVRQVVAYYEGHLDSYPGGSNQTERILQEVAETKQRGFSMTGGTAAIGLTGLGVAVLPSDGLVQLAVSVSAVTDRMDMGEARKMASMISNAIQRQRAARAHRGLIRSERFG